MAYDKTIWKDRVVQRPRTYIETANPDGSITHIPSEGTVTEAGTPVNATNLNKIENELYRLGTQDASTSQKGIVQLIDNATSTSTSLVPTANALKVVNDTLSAQLADPAQVTDEPIYLQTDAVEIKFTYGPIDLDSLVVTNTAKTVTYTAGTDYVKTVTGIKRVAGGAIAASATVLCSYSFAQTVKFSRSAEEKTYKVKPYFASRTLSKLRNGTATKIVFLGDSTTEQNATTQGLPNHVGLITTALQAKYPATAVTVYNKGISGNTSVDMFRRCDNDVIDLAPDLVVICTGINDKYNSVSLASFTLHYETMIQAILTTGAEIILRTPNVTNTGPADALLAPFLTVIKGLAIKYNLGLCDVFSVWADFINDGFSNTTDLTQGDKIHPNARGHVVIANEIMKFFEDVDTNYLSVPKPLPQFKMIKLNSSTDIYDFNLTKSTNANCFEDSLTDTGLNTLISHVFYGSGVRMVGLAGTTKGMLIVKVDGVTVNTVDNYNATDIFKNPLVLIEGLPLGWHTLDIINSEGKNPSSSGYGNQPSVLIVNAEANQKLPYKVLKLESLNCVKRGSWIEQTSANYILNFLTSTTTAGDSIEINFRGRFLKLLGMRTTSSGQFNLTIDGVDYGTIDCYAASNTFKNLVSSVGLANTTHKAVITVLSTKNSSSSNYNIQLSAIIVEDTSHVDIISAVDPANPYEGMRYYNTASHVNKTWNGSSWV